MKPSSVVTGGAISTRIASGVGGGSPGSPVVAMIEVNVSRRSGRSIAIVCAIAPPIDAPTTCARAMPSASSRPNASAAMSLRRYGASTGLPCVAAARAAPMFGTPAASKCVDSPMSRLSKRMTRKLRSAMRSQNSSGHAIICAARPMMRRIGGAPASPKLSQQSSMPLARARSGEVLGTVAIARFRLGGSDLEPLLADLGVPAQVVGRALEDDAAVAHHVAALRNLQRDRQLLLDQQDRDAAAAQLLQILSDELDDLWRQPFGRLVDHDQVGVAHQRAAKGQHL